MIKTEEKKEKQQENNKKQSNTKQTTGKTNKQPNNIILSCRKLMLKIETFGNFLVFAQDFGL